MKTGLIPIGKQESLNPVTNSEWRERFDHIKSAFQRHGLTFPRASRLVSANGQSPHSVGITYDGYPSADNLLTHALLSKGNSGESATFLCPLDTGTSRATSDGDRRTACHHLTSMRTRRHATFNLNFSSGMFRAAGCQVGFEDLTA